MDKIVIPVVLGKGSYPSITDLPPELARFAHLNAAFLTSDLKREDYSLTFQRLLERLRNILIREDSEFAITQEAIDAIEEGFTNNYWVDNFRDSYDLGIASLEAEAANPDHAPGRWR